METFKASNGIEIAWRDSPTGTRVLQSNAERCTSPVVALPGWTVVGAQHPDSSGVGFTENSETNKALREFFLHERDKELGRWRWPENPDYVVYPEGTSRLVVRESNGHGLRISLHDRKVLETHLDSYVGAARAYDTAHPEPKPWHDAEDGDVWALTGAGGLEQPFRRVGGKWLSFTVGAVGYSAEFATAGRRLWPEVVSDA